MARRTYERLHSCRLEVLNWLYDIDNWIVFNVITQVARIPVFSSTQFSAVLFLCIQEIVNGMKQPHWLGNDIVEQLHFQSTSRGFTDVDIHEYNWACRRRHWWLELGVSDVTTIKAMLTVWHALCHRPFCLFWPETGCCFVCPHDSKLLTRLPLTELGLFIKIYFKMPLDSCHTPQRFLKSKYGVPLPIRTSKVVYTT